MSDVLREAIELDRQYREQVDAANDEARTATLLAAIRQWDRASTDWQRGVAPAQHLHEAESRLRALARGEQ